MKNRKIQIIAVATFVFMLFSLGVMAQNQTIGTLKASQIGVGISVPVSSLDVNGNVSIGTYAGTTAAPSNGLIVSGKIGIGIAQPTQTLTVRGSFGITDSTYYTAFNMGTQTANIIYTLPTAQASVAGQVLTNNGSGVLSWVSTGGNEWSLTGNAGTTPTTHFIGTTDTNALIFKVNNVKSGLINSNTPNNTSFGYSTFINLTTGERNSAFGAFSLFSLTTGNYNTALGSHSLGSTSDGVENTAIGFSALGTLTTTNYNVGIGSYTLMNANGENNTSVGFKAGYEYGASYNLLNNCNNGVFIGYRARPLANNSNNEIVIGYDALGLGNNSMQLGNSSVTKYGFRGVSYIFPSAQGAAGTVLTNNGSGTLSWTTPTTDVNVVGNIDAQTKSANGAVISGNSIYLQSADATYPGLVSNSSQTFSGAKTFSSGPITLGTGTGTTAGSVVLNDATAGNSYTATIASPTSIPASYTLTLPADDGNANQVLTTNGTGTLSWTTPATGTVTSFSSGNCGILFSTSVATSTTTPALSFTLSNAGAYTLLGNNTSASAAPAYFTPSLASPLFQNQGTTTTVLHGNAAGNPTWSAVSLTADVSGTLPIANGGTGIATAATQGGILYGNSTTALGYSAAGTAGYFLTSAGTGAPTWTAPASMPNIYTADGSLTANRTVTQAANTLSFTNSATTGTAFDITGSGVYTGTGLFNISANSATTGTIAAINANALTSGNGLSIASTGTTTTGRLLNVSSASTGAFTNGGVYFNFTGAHTGKGVEISDATTTGTALGITASGTYTGTGLFTMTANSATTGTVATISANALTSGTALSINNALTNLTGKLLEVKTNSTANATFAFVDFSFSGAHTGWGLSVFDNTQTGTVTRICGNGLTSGTALDVTCNANSTFNGKVIQIYTAAAGAPTAGYANFSFQGNHTGSGIYVSDVTTAGNAAAFYASSLTTGNAISIIGGSALTSGSLLNASGDVSASTTKGLINIQNTAASTTGVVATIQANSTAGTGITVLGNGNVGINDATPGATLEVNGAAVNSAPTAGTTATVDFNTNNLAITSYVAASPAFTLNNLKNGGAYTLLLTGTTNSGTASFTASGFTIKYIGTSTMTSGKVHMYSFIVAGNVVYVTMGTEN